MEAANACKNIEKLHVGIITDSGLRILAEGLMGNESLEELTFSETDNHQRYWTEEARQAFVKLLKMSSKLKSVKAKFQKVNKGSDEAKQFETEIDFYTEWKSDCKKKEKKFAERIQSCDPTFMFENMVKHVEEKDKNERMPVRKFYNNTFGQLVNDALFALNKKISKAKGDEANELQYCEGKVKFMAMYLMNKLPDGELIPEEDHRNDD